MSGRTGAAARLALRFFENRYLLVLGIVIIFLAGYSALTNMPRIEDPRITARYPRVTTFLPGASAARVEALVTDTLEQAVREVSEVKKIESTSLPGVSILAVELSEFVGPGENERVFSEIRSRLNDVVGELPDGASVPFFDDKDNAVAFSKVLAIRWDGAGAPALGIMRRLAEDLADQLRTLPGTDVVRLYGAPQEEITVTVNGAELADLGLSAAAVAATIARADAKVPAGALRNDEHALFIEVGGEIDSIARVRDIPLRRGGGGQQLTVGDIGDVDQGWLDPPREITLTSGARSVLVAVYTSADLRLDRWAEQSTAVVEEFGRTVGGNIVVDTVFDQSVYTAERLSTLAGNLGAGALLVMLVVLIGMGWRAALIVGSALPLSGGLTLFGLSAAGQQMHQMTIFGMIIAIGLLIDNAIVMTDEIKKRLDDGETRADAVTGSLAHLFVPLLASTLTTILGFMPVFLLPGAMGDFVGPIAIAVVLALTSSFFMAVTIIPALAGLSLRRNAEHRRLAWWQDGFCSARLSAAYERLLTAAIGRPARTALACLVLPLSGFVLAGTLGQQFFPAADRDQFEIEVWLPSDASIERTLQRAQAIEAAVREEDGVRDMHWRVGGTYPTLYYNRIMRNNGDSAYAHAMVFTDSVAVAKRLVATLAATLNDRFPDARIVVAPFAQGPPVDAPVGFEIRGPDTRVLKALGDEVRRVMHTVPGILQTRATVTGGLPKLTFDADEFAVAATGMTLNDLALQIQANLEGQAGGTFLDDLEELPVRVRLATGERDSANALSSLTVTGPASGGSLPLSGLGEFALRPEPGSIARRDGIRSNDILGYIRHDALAIDVTNAIVERLEAEGFRVPPGYEFAVAGDSAEQANAFRSLFTYLPILLMLMVATIVLSFRSLRLAGLIGLVAVLSVGLGMLSLWVGGYARGFNAIIGSVGLVGVAINGTIVVLAAIRSNAGAAAGDLAGVVAETIGATRHIVSTTLTTVGGFVPLLLFSGGDFWPPLAIVIAGGVGFSITLSLLFTPSAYRLLHARRRAPTDAPAPLPAGAGA